MRKYLLSAIAVGVLSACVSPGAPAPQLTFANYPQVTLNTASANVVESYANPNDPQDISGQFVLAPAEAVKRYAANRYKAAPASSGDFTITIEDARVHMKQIDQKNKVLEWSGVGKEDEYSVTMRLRVDVQPDGMMGRQTTSIKMDRTLVMPSSVTLAEREDRQTKFLEKLIADIDSRIGDALDQSPAVRQ